MIRESLILGWILGGCHALAETTLIGWCGGELTVADFLILVLVYGSLGAMGGALLSIFVLPLVRPRCLLVPSILAYTAMGAWLVVGPYRGWHPWFGLVVVLLAGMGVLVPALRRPEDHLGLVPRIVGACFLTVGATIIATEGGSLDPAKRGWLVASFAVAGTAPFLVALAQRRRSSPHHRPGLGVAGLAVAGLLALDLGLWLTVWPADISWHARRAPARPEESRRARPEDPRRDRGGGERPDVILIVLDTVRADHMDLFGYSRETMPSLARFARSDCVVARPIVSCAPSSLASHGSIFTGMYPSSHGGHKPFADDANPPPFGYFVRDDVKTLAEAMTETGYRTVGISANHGVLSSFGLDRGFETYDATPARSHLPERLSWLGTFRVRGKSASRLLRRRLPRSWTRRAAWLNPDVPHYRRGEEVIDLAMSRIEAYPDEQLFLFLNLMDAHSPYLPVSKLADRFVERPSGIDWTGYPHHLLDGGAAGVEEIGPQNLEFIIGQYDAELLYLDGQCRRFFDALKAAGRYDEAMIIVVSDHGESFGEHGELHHGRSLYQSQVSVPLLIKLPRSRSGVGPASAGPMQTVDLFPTILRVAGGEIPDTVEGSPWAVGRNHSLSERFAHTRRGERPPRELVAVTLGNWKYIRTSTGEEESYDLADDPGELKNLIGTDPVREEEARRIIAARDARLLRLRSGSRIDRAALERLRSLGYVK
ncbi:MAG: sulfatase [Planctomycetota bacterium]|nr:sulfatase [Planctomycetota bacterium]